MRLSVLIPTYQRPDRIERCLAALAADAESSQSDSASPPPNFEVIVAIDGGLEPPGSEHPDPAVPESIATNTRIVRLPRVGVIGARKELLRLAGGDIVVWLNDDSLARPGLKSGLLRAHTEMHTSDTPRVVSGRAVWVPAPQPDLFDRLVEDTDLVFFTQPRDADGEPYRIDYRNCFGLNMSFPIALAREAGGLPEIAEVYGYDDIELAHRLEQAGAQIWRTTEAVVDHDHRYRPLDVVRREYLLGRTAWHYAGVNPGFCLDLFRRDIRSPEELEFCARAVERDRGDASRIERTFVGLASLPADAASPELLPTLAQHWTPLKRYLWRWGLLDAASGQPSRWAPLNDDLAASNA